MPPAAFEGIWCARLSLNASPSRDIWWAAAAAESVLTPRSAPPGCIVDGLRATLDIGGNTRSPSRLLGEG